MHKNRLCKSRRAWSSARLSVAHRRNVASGTSSTHRAHPGTGPRTSCSARAKPSAVCRRRGQCSRAPPSWSVRRGLWHTQRRGSSCQRRRRPRRCVVGSRDTTQVLTELAGQASNDVARVVLARAHQLLFQCKDPEVGRIREQRAKRGFEVCSTAKVSVSPSIAALADGESWRVSDSGAVGHLSEPMPLATAVDANPQRSSPETLRTVVARARRSLQRRAPRELQPRTLQPSSRRTSC